MAEPLGGIPKSEAAKLGRVVRQVLGRLPDVGRRTRRVYSGGGSGGTGAEIISFEIIDTATIYDTATILGAYCQVMVCRILTASCGSSYAPGDEVYVWDSHQCLFDIAFELLDGAKGYAVRMTTLEDYEVNDQDGGLASERPCRWEVLRMCCVEETTV